MHNHDDKYPSRSGFEPGTPRLPAPIDTNEPSGPASCIYRALHKTDLSTIVNEFFSELFYKNNTQIFMVDDVVLGYI